MKRSIKSISLLNFKGTRECTYNLVNKNQLVGDNETGKTTVADAFNWVMYGKDSNGNTDFDIKTLDKDNNPIHKLEHEVELIFSDGIKLRKVYKEKWTRKRGSENEELTTHTTDYFVDDVPKSKAEYSTKIDSILDAKVSRLITDLSYFNEVLEWKQCRVVISELASKPTTAEINDNSSEDLTEIVALINQGNTTEDEKKIATTQKNLSKKELATIEPKIEEVRRMMPEKLDFIEISESITNKTLDKESVIQSINDVSLSYTAQAQANAELIKTKSEKETKLSTLKSEQRNTPNAALDSYYLEKNEKTSTKIRLEGELSTQQTKCEQLENTIGTKNEELLELRSKRATTQERVFILPSDESCPTCKQSIEIIDDEIDKLRDNFNTQKQTDLDENKRLGLLKKDEIFNSTQEFEKAKRRGQEMSMGLTELKNEIESLVQPEANAAEPTDAMIKLQEEIAAIVIPPIVKPDISELNAKTISIQTEIDELNKQLGTKETIEKNEARIVELGKQARELSQAIANFEKLEFLISCYENSEMDLVEKRVNGMFDLVKFKMFNPQMNGGIEPTCVAMINGVPYKSLNSAGKIQASLDIIKTIQKHYEIYAPVFIDNRESISVLPNMNCQTIELIVRSPFDKAKELNRTIRELQRMIEEQKLIEGDTKWFEDQITEIETEIKNISNTRKEIEVFHLD